MTFAAQIIDDVSSVFFNTDDFAVSITYTRGANSVTLPAIFDPTPYDELKSPGFAKVETSEFQVESSKLVLSGSRIEPRIGDRISVTINGKIGTCQVSSTNNQSCFQWADQGQTIIKIRTTKIKIENA